MSKFFKKGLYQKIGLYLVFFSIVTPVFAQSDSRSYIKEQMRRWGSCRVVAITKTNGDLALYGRNGWAASGIPRRLETEIRDLNANGEFIRDVVLTENGRWLILYGDNGVRWDGIPERDPLLSTLRHYNEQRERITSVTFNDYGDWVVVTTNYFVASDDYLQDWLREGYQIFGQIWTVTIFDDDGAVAVHEEGYRYLGNVPQNLRDALRRTNLNVYTVKVSGTSWFFADEDGNFEGWM